jgi:hypothetical protein
MGSSGDILKYKEFQCGCRKLVCEAVKTFIYLIQIHNAPSVPVRSIVS